ncbi:hypothetical protein BD626DRAFT_215301 [Schizophyllum amplum]|uniref:Uncharacterized protein n=1 Tax=Schizophyllum amplum TaxID=97359 RepID=A0A550CK90_9AGAR|nr:hypothetical protein BD626DRAFT_215301 [Auriculariopsis ampla]
MKSLPSRNVRAVQRYCVLEISPRYALPFGDQGNNSWKRAHTVHDPRFSDTNPLYLLYCSRPRCCFRCRRRPERDRWQRVAATCGGVVHGAPQRKTIAPFSASRLVPQLARFCARSGPFMITLIVRNLCAVTQRCYLRRLQVPQCRPHTGFKQQLQTQPMQGDYHGRYVQRYAPRRPV